MRGGERGSSGTAEKKQRIGDGHLINDTIPEPYGHEIDTREVERNNQREIGMETKYYKATLYNDGTFEVSDYKEIEVYAIRQSKNDAINAIRKHVEKELIRAKEDVDKLEKILLQLK